LTRRASLNPFATQLIPVATSGHLHDCARARRADSTL